MNTCTSVGSINKRERKKTNISTITGEQGLIVVVM